MFVENATAFFTVLLEFLIFCVQICECAVNQHNVITVTQPAKDAIWISGQTSYLITWTQSKFSFKWNIALLDREKNRVTDISTGLSEFNEIEMAHHWLVPQSIQSGSYRVEICASTSSEDCGSSELFSIRNGEGKKS